MLGMFTLFKHRNHNIYKILTRKLKNTRGLRHETADVIERTYQSTSAHTTKMIKWAGLG